MYDDACKRKLHGNSLTLRQLVLLCLQLVGNCSYEEVPRNSNTIIYNLILFVISNYI